MASVEEQINDLSKQVQGTDMPDELRGRILTRLGQLLALTSSPTFLVEFDNISRYIGWVLSLPWNKRTQDTLDLAKARQILDSHHYGLEEIKDRILEYLAVMKLKQERGEGAEVLRAPILCFVGLVGTGKTTIASSIAEAMGRGFARIPFGGMGDPLDLRGRSRMYPESEPGKVIKSLRATQSMNSVILLDEIDRVTEQGRSSIMGVLVELLDPEQNKDFVDHYIDFPFNLSECLFVATANNTTSLATAVIDRLEPIRMPSYTDEEKITIGKKYMLPKLIKLAGIPADSLDIEDAVWAQVVRPLGFDAGMRTLERTIQGVVRKVALEIVNSGKTSQTFKVTTDNIKQFLPS